MGIFSSKNLTKYTDSELDNYIKKKNTTIEKLKKELISIKDEKKKERIDKRIAKLTKKLDKAKNEQTRRLNQQQQKQQYQQQQYQQQQYQQQHEPLNVNKKIEREGIDDNTCNINLPYVYSIMLQLSKNSILSDENIRYYPQKVYEFLISNKIIKIQNGKIHTGVTLNKDWNDMDTDSIQFKKISTSCHPDKNGGKDETELEKLSREERSKIEQNMPLIKEKLTTIFKVITMINDFGKAYIEENKIITSDV